MGLIGLSRTPDRFQLISATPIPAFGRWGPATDPAPITATVRAMPMSPSPAAARARLPDAAPCGRSSEYTLPTRTDVHLGTRVDRVLRDVRQGLIGGSYADPSTGVKWARRPSTAYSTCIPACTIRATSLADRDSFGDATRD